MKKIPLTQGKVALIDNEDYSLIKTFRWFSNKMGKLNIYAVSTIYMKGQPNITLLMHRLLANAPLGVQVDHIDGNGLNNQKSNLRLCDAKGNNCNRQVVRGISKYKGVMSAVPLVI